jgi:hypothetical protein
LISLTFPKGVRFSLGLFLRRRNFTCNAAVQHVYLASGNGLHPGYSGAIQMTKTTDFTKVMQDMMASFPVDASAYQNAFKTQAAFGEKLASVALAAAEKSTELSAKWAKDSLAKLSETAKAKAEPADYTKAATDFATAAAEMAAENMAAFAEIAKKVQMDTVELMLAAGKNASEETTAAMKKATADVTAQVKKAAAAAK